MHDWTLDAEFPYFFTVTTDPPIIHKVAMITANTYAVDRSRVYMAGHSNGRANSMVKRILVRNHQRRSRLQFKVLIMNHATKRPTNEIHH